MVLGAGIEPATLGLSFRCSNQLSYPKATCRSRTGDQWTSHRSTSELTSGGTARPGRRHTRRQRRAHRTGWHPVPLAAIKCSFPLPSPSKRQILRRFHSRRPRPAPGRSACAPHERNFPVSGHSMPGCLGILNRQNKKTYERAKQNAPGMVSEGVRVPRRSMQPISATGDQSIRWWDPAAARYRTAHAVPLRAFRAAGWADVR